MGIKCFKKDREGKGPLCRATRRVGGGGGGTDLTAYPSYLTVDHKSPPRAEAPSPMRHTAVLGSLLSSFDKKCFYPLSTSDGRG